MFIVGNVAMGRVGVAAKGRVDGEGCRVFSYFLV